MSLQGQIEEMGLGPVIQALSLNRYRGTLRIEIEDAGSQFFFISEGEIVLVRQVQRDPVRLGDLLVRAGKVRPGELEQALAQQRGSGKRLGELLVELGHVRPEDIDRVIRGKFEEDFLDLFLLDRGRFEFIFGLTPEALFAPDEKLERVTLNTSGLMLEAMRRVDEWQDMIRSLGSLDTIFSHQGAGGDAFERHDFSGVGLPEPARERLFRLLDGTQSLREVLGLAIRDGVASRLETFQFLHHLCAEGLVVPLDTKTLLGHARSALNAKDVPRAAKYIRAILGRKGELETGLIRRYLDFLRKNRRPKLAFDEARMFAAQCLARGESKQAIELYEEAIALEYRNAEVLDRLFYALLRDNQRQRAVEVGLMLRDYLGGDADLQVAARVVRNLKELAPDDPEVHELAGLVLKRREQNEVAAGELEAALAGMPPNHARRSHVVAALLELQPEREDLRAERESFQLFQARENLRREFRRRLVVVGLVPSVLLLLVVVLWRGTLEVQARQALSEALALYDQGPGERFVRYKQISDLLTYASLRGWSVRSEAEALKQQVDGKIADYEQERQSRFDQLLLAEKAEEERRRVAEAEAKRRAERDEAVAAVLTALRAEDYALASRLAMTARERFPAEEDPRIGDLKVWLRVDSEPGGARVSLDGSPVGQTPCTVPVHPGAAVQLRVYLRGYEVVEEELIPQGFVQRAFPLRPGPTWSVPRAGAPLALQPGGGRFLVADPDGRVTALDARDGRVSWSREVLADLPAPAPGGLDWARTAGAWLVLAAGERLLGLGVEDGVLLWTEAGLGTPAAPGLAVRLGGELRLLLPLADRLALLDPATGKVTASVALPAAPACQPGWGGGRAFLPLVDGRLAAVSCDDPTAPQLAWVVEGTSARLTPIYLDDTDALLVQDGDRLQTRSARDGQVLALLQPDLGPIRSLAVAGERVYVLGANGSLAALRVYDGALLLPGSRPAPAVSGGPVVVGGDLLLIDGDGQLIRLTRSGRRRDAIQLGGPLVGEPLVDGDRLLLPLADRLLLVEPVEED